MNGIVKVLTCILGVLAVVACLATVGIIGYSFTGAADQKQIEASQNQDKPQEMVVNTVTAESAIAIALLSFFIFFILSC